VATRHVNTNKSLFSILRADVCAIMRWKWAELVLMCEMFACFHWHNFSENLSLQDQLFICDNDVVVPG
jgi:hypothetical protein